MANLQGIGKKKNLPGQACHQELIPLVGTHTLSPSLSLSLTHTGVFEMYSSWLAAGFLSRLLISDFH